MLLIRLLSITYYSFYLLGLLDRDVTWGQSHEEMLRDRGERRRAGLLCHLQEHPAPRISTCSPTVFQYFNVSSLQQSPKKHLIKTLNLKVISACLTFSSNTLKRKKKKYVSSFLKSRSFFPQVTSLKYVFSDLLF